MKDLPIFDGHNDTLLDLYEKAVDGEPEAASDRTFWDRNFTGYIDYPSAPEGGYGKSVVTMWSLPSLQGVFLLSDMLRR